MNQQKGILLIVIAVLIIIAEIIRHNNGNTIWSWVFSIAALSIAIFSAASKNSRLKRNDLIIMLVVALLFILYPFIFKQ